MKNSIIIEVKTVYGIERIYPVCDNAKLFAFIAGTKTLSEENLRAVRKLGFEIEQKFYAADFITEVYQW